jgi:hypothetical protein
MLPSYTEFYEQKQDKGRKNQYSSHPYNKYDFQYVDLTQLITGNTFYEQGLIRIRRNIL